MFILESSSMNDEFLNVTQNTQLQLLEQIHKCALNGKRFADSQFDVDRYSSIIEWVEKLYESNPDFSKILLEPHDPVGYVTPKIGINAIIINEEGQILLEKRIDDNSWCLPGGWCEVGITAEDNLHKEVKEETGYEVEIVRLYRMFCRTPNKRSVQTTYHIVYECKIIGGELAVSHESQNVAWLNPNDVEIWHWDHEEWVEEFLKK